MDISLPWGKEYLIVSIPDSWNVNIPKRISYQNKNNLDEEGIIKYALNNPIGLSPLSSLNLAEKRILIVIDDNTRPTPTHKFFHLILDELIKAGANKNLIHLIPGIGIHTPMSESDMAKKIGEHNLKQIAWSNHDAFNSKLLHYFGETSLKTPVILNKKLNECDLVVIIGMIEPHLWAGYGGGLKNIFPGLASASAIGEHHVMISKPPYIFNRVGIIPENNDFRLDLEEIKNFIPANMFLLDVILDDKQNIINAFAGDPIKAHREGVKFCIKTSGLKIEKQVDGIIVNSYPMEINFKQSMKCVANSLPALSRNGVVMGFLRAEKGLDDIPLPDKPPPYPILKSLLKLMGKPNVIRFLNIVKKDLKVEEKFLAYYTLMLMREYNLFLYVPTLNSKEIRHLGFFHHCNTPQEVVDRASKKLKKNANVIVFPEGGSTFPIIGDTLNYL